jgi:Immunoglobulin I-set domain
VTSSGAPRERAENSHTINPNQARIAAEEIAKKEAEEAAIRKAAEDAAYDSDKELIPVKEDPAIEWAAVEEEEPLVPGVLQELLEQRAEEGEAEEETESESEMTEKDRDLAWQRERQMMRPPLVISHLKSRAVAMGQTAKLTCNVTGPAITVRWLKNGNPIELKPDKYKFFNSEGLLSLEIMNVKKRDGAEYTCLVKNKNGETETIASLTVYESVDTERPVPPTFITIKGNFSGQSASEKVDKSGLRERRRRACCPYRDRAPFHVACSCSCFLCQRCDHH